MKLIKLWERGNYWEVVADKVETTGNFLVVWPTGDDDGPVLYIPEGGHFSVESIDIEALQ